VPGCVLVEQGRVIVGRDLNASVLVANKVAGEVDRLEGDTVGVGESLPQVEACVFGKELISKVTLMLPEVVVLVAKVVARVVHTLKGDRVSSSQTVNNAEAGVLVVEVASLVLISPSLIVPVADVVLGVVVGADGHSSGVDNVPGGIGVEQGRVVAGGDLHASVLVADEVAGEVDRLKGHSAGISESLPQVETRILGEKGIAAVTLMFPEVVVLVAQEVAGIVGALERDSVASHQAGDDPPSGVLAVKVALLMLISPSLIVPVADVVLGVVVRTDDNGRHLQ